MKARSHFTLPAIAVLSLLLGLGASLLPAQEFSWQKPHAKVLPEGDLDWAPEPYRYQPGKTVRFIDYEDGNDANPGTPDKPWKHHPWDPASRITADVSNVDTYVFRGGVTYRGSLKGKPQGSGENPIRLTRDPRYGNGEAFFVGSRPVTGKWEKVPANDAPKGLPEPGKVWRVKLGKGPRPWCVWNLQQRDTRLPLARTPNWKVKDGQMDVMADWYEWKWNQIGKVQRKVGNRNVQVHWTVDKENLTLPADAYTQAYVWTEWGPVMGTPCAREVIDFEEENSKIYFPGFWGGGGRNIYGGNRYYLENSPYFLDEEGEWWFDESTGMLYLMPPGGEDPARLPIEVARHGTLIELESGTKNVSISGLSFSFTNVHTPHRRFADQAVIRCMGSADGINVSHCRFYEVNLPVRIKAAGAQDRVDNVRLTDNEIGFTDYGVCSIADGMSWGKKHPPIGQLGDVKVLRNRVFRAGMRPGRSDNGHAIRVNFAETLEVAGNFLTRCYGSGIFIFGGKSSGYLGDVPLSRVLIHHNKVTHCLLRTNDWGNIETWQGGPHYVFNNISGNPWGYWNWQKRHFGFAYYMDGSFKNYQFNNIAWGTSSQARPHGNTSAFQEIISYQNSVFNNSIFRFVVGSRRQAPQAGRDLFAGNIWEDIGEWILWHGRPAESEDQANQADVGKVGKTFAYETMAYANNIFVGDSENIGVFEANGMPHKTVDSMRQALKKRGARAFQLGKRIEESPYLDPENQDFRLKSGTEAIDYGVRVFVPWGLYAMVGEWNFARNNEDPTVLIDDHWFLTSDYTQRQEYYKVPTFPLKGVGIGAEDYVTGPLETWTPAGALKLNGQDQYLMLKLSPEEKDQTGSKTPAIKTHKPEDWISIQTPEKIIPGEPFKAIVKLNGIEKGKKVEAHLHWAQGTSWGGFNVLGLPAVQEVTGKDSYTFTFKPEAKAGLTGFNLMVFTGPGGFGNKEKVVRVSIPAGPPAPANLGKLKSPALDTSSFIIEAYLKLDKGSSGVIMQKRDGRAGYALTVEQGGKLKLFAGGKQGSATVTAQSAIDDGQWHHVLAECDRQGGKVTLFIDGKADAAEAGIGPKVSMANRAPVYVGGTPEGDHLGATLEFLRISGGSLADAKTSIQELYAWQFDGPHLRDFLGNAPAGKGRDAGALEYTGK